MIARDLIVFAGTFGTTVDLEANDPFTASYLNDWDTDWGKLTVIFVYYTAWTYCMVGKRQRNDRKGYLALYDHFLGPNNVDNMASATENILQNTVYHG